MYNFVFLILGVLAVFALYFLIRSPLGFALILAKWICYVLTVIAVLLAFQLFRSSDLLWTVTAALSAGLIFLSLKLRRWVADA